MFGIMKLWFYKCIFIAFTGIPQCMVLCKERSNDSKFSSQKNSGIKCVKDDCFVDYRDLNTLEELDDTGDILDEYEEEPADYELMFDYPILHQDHSSGKILGVYARYDEILAWQRNMCKLYSDIVTLYNIGYTYEGRPTLVIKIGLPMENKRSIWIDGGIHGREHIAPATVIYLSDKLVRGYGMKDEDVLQMLRNYDFYLLPVLNPDGYEYTHTNDRDWRKNRRVSNENCTGVDLNRNWKHSWGGDDSSSDPCSNEYMGVRPESEPEVKNVARFIRSYSSQFIAFITYHSYGQRIFTRWDNKYLHPPENHNISLKLAYRMASAMSTVKPRDYLVGVAPLMTYSFGGGSADWAKAVAGIPYSYLIELPDTGQYKFQLPVEEILPTGREQWLALKRLTSDLIKLNNEDEKFSKEGQEVEKDYNKDQSFYIEPCDTEPVAHASYEYLLNNGVRKTFISADTLLTVGLLCLLFIFCF